MSICVLVQNLILNSILLYFACNYNNKCACCCYSWSQGDSIRLVNGVIARCIMGCFYYFANGRSWRCIRNDNLCLCQIVLSRQSRQPFGISCVFICLPFSAIWYVISAYWLWIWLIGFLDYWVLTSACCTGFASLPCPLCLIATLTAFPCTTCFWTAVS